MRRREVERIARRAVPGSGAPRVSPLSAGPLHDTFRVERDGRSFSMRLAAAAQNGAWLLRVLQRAADQALAPPLVYGDAQGKIIVHMWVEGRAWPAAAVRVARNIERVAALLRRVHALQVPTPARALTPAMWVRHYSAALAAQKRRVPRTVKGTVKGTKRRAAILSAAPALAAAAHDKLQRLQALPAITRVVCHSDLHRLNLLEYRPPLAKAGALLLLDWEYAHVSEPFWDLAGWSANNDYPEVLQRRLLAAYLERTADEAEWTRCKLLYWLYDYVCLLWSELYLSSRRGGGAELAARAARLQSRLIAGND
jgi:thiamine kinase-like enzyme